MDGRTEGWMDVGMFICVCFCLAVCLFVYVTEAYSCEFASDIVGISVCCSAAISFREVKDGEASIVVPKL